MEQVGGGGHIGDLHVTVLVLAGKLVLAREDARVLVGKLQVTLDTGRRVLRALSVIAVGQGHDETSTLHPLDFTGGDELVNDALSVVGKVTKLGLPHDKSVGGRQRVTVLESKSTKLTQRRIGDDKLALVLADVLEGSVSGLVLLVVEDGVALREGTTLNILTGNTNVVTLGDERTEGQSLGGGEVNVLALDDGLGTVVEDTFQVAVNGEALGGRANDLTNVLDGLLVDIGRVVGKNLGGQLLGGLETVPGRGGPFLGGRGVVLGLGEALLEHAPDPLLVLFDILLGEGTLLQELVDVDIDLGNL